MSSLLRGATALLLASSLSGCGLIGELTTQTMTGEEVAKEAETQLRTLPNVVDGEMECPDLEDEVGNEVRCTRTVEGDGVRVEIGVTVEVVEPDEDGNNLAIQVDDEPESVTVLADALESTIEQQFQQQVGRAPESIDCPELPGVVGESVDCALVDQGEDLSIRVTATAVEGTEVSFETEVVE